MKKIFFLLIIAIVASCGNNTNKPGTRIISVSIAPFKYFVKEIGGSVFDINIMVPAGSNPHIYEPFPDQIRDLRKSVAYISDGYLGFEITWLDRFYEMNKDMKRLSLSESVVPIYSNHHESDGHAEGADPHFWVSPECAFRMALAIKNFLCTLDPEKGPLFEKNYTVLYGKIKSVDSLARQLSSGDGKKVFMIYHPNLAYLARDYGLEEVPVEFEGKEPSPSRMRYLIDLAKMDNLKIIMVQKEYDTKNATAITDETGGKVVIIDPLSEDWYTATSGIINVLNEEFDTEMK
jgi:zinc transport system substrate-binding protein